MTSISAVTVKYVIDLFTFNMNPLGRNMGTILAVTAVLSVISGIDGFLDFTCFNPNPRIDINGNDNSWIGGYRSGGDKDVSVSFGRTSNTGTSNGLTLPVGSSELEFGHISARKLDMLASDRKTRIGAFYCNANKNGGVNEKITTIIMSSESTITPRKLSQTVSVGQQVTFDVNTNVDISQLRWRHNGAKIQSLDGHATYTIENVTLANKGVYECYQANERNNAFHAIFLLIVRECQSGKWNPPSCSSVCPICLNNGICDERSGVCVCAPGFKGTNCENVLGRNTWGQDGAIVCSSTNNKACSGKLFCLPHPYGCSCQSGYRGLDCDEDCSPGTFGAGCRSQCHCQSGVTCALDTGVCPRGKCEDGWSGVNCQLTDLSTSSYENTITASWEQEVCIRKTYIVEYELIQHGQCPRKVVRLELAGETTSTSYRLTQLFNDSTYKVYVTTVVDSQSGERVSSPEQRTSAAAPMFKHSIISSRSIPNGLSFEWDDTPCYLIGGSGLQYEYQLWDKSQNNIESTGVINGTSVEIKNLIECQEYFFHVRAINDFGDGDWSDTATESTRKIATGPVNEFEVFRQLSTELSVRWSQSDDNNCLEDYYEVQYKVLNIDQCMGVDGEWTTAGRIDRESHPLTASLTDLVPYTTYKISVTPFIIIGGIKGQTTKVDGTTAASEPSGPPVNVSAVSITSNTIAFEWSQPECGERRGEIVAYSYTLTNSEGEEVDSGNVHDTSVFLEELAPFTNYSFSISARTRKGPGPSLVINVTTAEGVPSAPRNLMLTNIGRASMLATWVIPQYPNGEITKYMVTYYIIARPYDLSFDSTLMSSSKSVDVSAEEMQYRIENLEPSTRYRVNVTAHSMAGAGIGAVDKKFTNPASSEDIPRPRADNRQIGDITSSTVKIQIITSDSKYVTGYQVKVEPHGVQKRQTSPENGYIAAELMKSKVMNDAMFVVGDNNTYGGFHNKPLIEGDTYTLYIGAVSRINETTFSVVWSEELDVTIIPSTSSTMLTGGQTPVLIPVLIVIVLVVAVIVGVLVVRIKKRYKSEQTEDGRPNTMVLTQSEDTREQGHQNNDLEEVSSQPVPPPKSPMVNRNGPIKLAKFESYVQEKKDSQTNSFKADFATLPGDNLHPWTAAKKEENVKKNRYANITTYDNARVILQPLDNDPDSDFINASFIDGVYEEKKYIASQGPNKASVDDFWRMVWQYKVKKIIMLTMLVETGKIKCQQYWPTKQIILAGVTITPKGEEIFPDFVIRIFELSSEVLQIVREVRQYHFTSWPDMSVPQAPILLNFMKIVNAYEPNDEAPSIVHCSAGVGRTGTYIAVDEMMRQAKYDKAVDVYGFVSKMRNKRMKMVQTSSQYQFIYDALLDAFTSAETTIEKKDFGNQLPKLMKQGNNSELSKQYKALEKLTEYPPENKCKGGLDPSNASKNRFPYIVPLDRTRPYLMTDMTEYDGTSSNYINAAFVNGYMTKDKFIVTQSPLPDTAADIWRLLYDHKSNIIVMLNHLDYKDPSMIQYWPDKGSSGNFGPLKVTCVDQDESVADIIVRRFQLVNTKNKGEASRTIQQFVLQTWSPGEDEAQTSDSVVTLIQCLKQHVDKEKLQRITVHCIDGVGATSVFCVAMMVLDQIEHAQKIDVFQAIRQLRLVRPQAVRNLAQYIFCHKIIQSHIEPVDDKNLQCLHQQEDDSQIYANVPTSACSGGAGPNADDGSIYANVNG